MFSDQTRIRYLPPTRPELLAVGTARPTVSTRRRIRVTVATTLPASVTATVAHNGRAERRPEWSGCAALIGLPFALGPLLEALVSRGVQGGPD